MAFKKGHNKLGGRTKGTPNKKTSETRELIRNFVNGQLNDIQTLYDKLSPYAKMELLTRLMPYTIGKLQDEQEADEENTNANRIEIVFKEYEHTN
jgi:hypothetical protein